MLRRTVYISRVVSRLKAPNSIRGSRAFSNSYLRFSDPFPSVLENVVSPLEVTSVLRSGKGFKLRTLHDPEPRTVHGNLIVLDGEYFLWRPELYSPQSGVLDIAPESWGILDVISPKPEIVVLGTGDRIMFVQRAREVLAKMGIQLEIQDTKNAASMFNLLQTEGRSVAAALLVEQSLSNTKISF